MSEETRLPDTKLAPTTGPSDVEAMVRPSRDPLPTLETRRLVLREIQVSDATAVQRWASDRDIASTTLTIPHPYEVGMAEEWIQIQLERTSRGEGVGFAIVGKETNQLIGTIGLSVKQEHDRGELGYWLGKPWWGQGFATEAARAVLRYGFEVLGLNRIYASYFARNPASGRVMEKLGMRYEGEARQHVKKWGAYEDLRTYAMLRGDFDPVDPNDPGGRSL